MLRGVSDANNLSAAVVSFAHGFKIQIEQNDERNMISFAVRKKDRLNIH